MEENKPHVFKLMLRILLFLVLIIGSVRPVVNHSAEQMDSQIRNTVYSVKRHRRSCSLCTLGC